MFVRPGYRAAVLHAPAGFAGLEPLPDDASVDRSLLGGHYDWILLFGTRELELDKRIPQARDALKDGGLLWVAYPKGVEKAKLPTDLKRETVWAAGERAGLASVAQVSIDDVWSAMRMKKG